MVPLDWSAVGVAGGWDDSLLGEDRLLAENEELAMRLRRVSVALSELVGDLAASRRENARLKRELSELRRSATAPSPRRQSAPEAQAGRVPGPRLRTGVRV